MTSYPCWSSSKTPHERSGNPPENSQHFSGNKFAKASCVTMKQKIKWYINWVITYQIGTWPGNRKHTILSESVWETWWNACKEWGSSRGAIGSQEPFVGDLILIIMCQLRYIKKKKKKSNKLCLNSTLKSIDSMSSNVTHKEILNVYIF